MSSKRSADTKPSFSSGPAAEPKPKPKPSKSKKPPLSSNDEQPPPPPPPPSQNPSPNPKGKPSKNPVPSSNALKSTTTTKPSKSSKPSAPMDSSDAASAPKAHRKRKVHDDRPSSTLTAGAGKSNASGHRRMSEDDGVAILRGAIDFRARTGGAPTKSNMAAIYNSIKGALSAPLTEDQVYNRLRHVRHKLNHAADGPGDDLELKLAAKLWPADVEKHMKDKKDEKKKKKEKEEEEEEENRKEKNEYIIASRDNRTADMEIDGDVQQDKDEEDDEEHEDEEGDEEEEEEEHKGEEKRDNKEVQEKGDKEVKENDTKELRGAPELFPYLTHAATEYWKAHHLSSITLEEGLKAIDPSRARALEEKWRRQLNDEMKFQADWAKLCREILLMLHETHKDMS